jgi:hypothetical protein
MKRGDADDDNSARVWDEAMDLVDQRQIATTLLENPTEESLIRQLSEMTQGPGGGYASSVEDASFQDKLLKSCVSQVLCVPVLLCREKAGLHTHTHTTVASTYGHMAYQLGGRNREGLRTVRQEGVGAAQALYFSRAGVCSRRDPTVRTKETI